jgi:hypothetical protein
MIQPQKKVVTRTTAIVLGVVCIILAGGLVGYAVYFSGSYHQQAS